VNTIAEAFEELQNTLVRNIANHLIQIEFHETATDEEMETFYNGASVEREALIEDSKKRLKSDQTVLKFLKDNNVKLISKYGDKNPTGDLGLTKERTARTGTQPDGGSESAREDDGGGSGQSSNHNARPRNDATKSDHSDSAPKGNAKHAGSGPSKT